MAKIPLKDLDAQQRPIRDEMLRALTRCLDSRKYILGEEVERFEKGVAELCRTAFAVGASSGTDALLMSLMALGVEAGDEVVTTAFSFFATAGVVSRLGAKPVFVDIDERTFNIDSGKVEAAITDRTKVLVPVHLYGQCADMAPLLEIAGRRGLVVMEDAAQAIGARYRDGSGAGSMGAVGCFSFYPSKNLGAVGEAGMVVTHDGALAETLRRLRNHGEEETYVHEIVGGNFRMDAMQAAVLDVKLRYVEEWTLRLRERARFYDELFEESGLVGDGSVVPPSAVEDHVYHQYVIRVRPAARDGLREDLAGEGIASAIYYPVPLPLQPCFRELGYASGDFPEAERAAKETLAIPIYPELAEQQQRTVVDAIRRSLRSVR